MRKKLFLIYILILVVAVFVSCSKANISQSIKNKSIVTTTEKAADESLPLSVQKNYAKQQENEDTKTEDDIYDANDNQDGQTDVSDTKEANENITECMLSVRCDAILNNMDKLDKSKISMVPKDGIIFPQTKVIFYAGESAYNVLSRELKKHGIHIDFVNAPMYNTVYIKGISNLYEHDCGELSGWIYKVNGIVPGYGCSQYILKDGDNIEFVYTCDLGRDIK